MYRFLLVLFSTGAFAATIYQTGFEVPTIATGLLSGQDNWSGSGSGATTVVETTVVNSGSQAVIDTPQAGNNFERERLCKFLVDRHGDVLDPCRNFLFGRGKHPAQCGHIWANCSFDQRKQYGNRR